MEYIEDLLDAANKMVIRVSNKEVIYINKFAVNYFERKLEKSIENTLDNLIYNHVSKLQNMKSFVNDFFVSLVLSPPNQKDLIFQEGKDLKQILSEILNNKNFSSKIFTHLGKFRYNSENCLNILIRRVNQNVLEIMIDDISTELMKNDDKHDKDDNNKKQMKLGKIAHEFKTPLLTIISLIKKIKEKCENEEIKSDLDKIDNLSNYSFFLIFDIIQFTSNTVDFKLSKSELKLRDSLNFSNNVLKTLVECNESKFGKIETKMEIDDAIDNLIIISDENRLKQILLNFVSNAYKFTKSGSIVIRAKYSEQLNNVKISVEDTGFGIKDKDIPLIFKEHTQLNLEKEYTSNGSGLGLSIANSLATALNHKIGFESKYGKGSKFYIILECYNNIDISYSEMNQEFSIKEKTYKNMKKSKTTKSQYLMKENTINNEVSVRTTKTLRKIYTNKNNNNSSIALHENNNNSNIILFKNESKIDNSLNHQLSFNSQLIINDEHSKSITIPYLNIKDNHECSNKDDLNKRIISLSSKSNNSINEKNSKILVVDDNLIIRKATVNLIKNILRELKINDIEIVELTDGIDILYAIMMDKTYKIKYIFTDECMEYLNGSEAARIIRKMEENNKIPFYHLVSVTALQDDKSRTFLLNSGFDNIISKPSSYSDIKNILNNPYLTN